MGHTLLPCLLGGDDMQLPPTVMTKDDKDDDGNHRNRLGADGTMSALEFFRASGWPIYRPPDPTAYGQGSLRHLPPGGVQRRAIQLWHPKRPSQPHHRGQFGEIPKRAQYMCIVDEVTHSKRNPDQVANTLDFLVDMVKTARINAADMAIITPYAANVELVNRRRVRPEYEALAAMPPRRHRGFLPGPRDRHNGRYHGHD
ncbi:hypothetical protein GGI35DRAFT_490571 [Trichoderma velutinum]